MEELHDFRSFRAKGRPTVELDGGQVLAAAADVPELRRLGLDTVEGALRFCAGEKVREAGPRCTRRVETRHGIWYLKTHHGLPLRRRIALSVAGAASPARREWDNLGALRRAGFDVAEAVAVGEAAAALGASPRSFLVMREVPGPSLATLLREGFPEVHQQSAARTRRRVLRDLAGLVRRFHANGFYHRDLYLAHFLVAEDPRWGRPYLIDVERVEQGFPPRRRWLVKDLAALHTSAPAAVSRADRLRFLLEYLCKSRLDPLVRRWIREILAKSARMGRHVPRHP